MKFIRRIAIVLLAMLMLFTAGCSGSSEPPKESSPILPNNTPGTLPLPPDSANPPATDIPNGEELAEMADASLNSLRQAMVGTTEIFAVAYFGYQNTSDFDGAMDPFEAMATEAPQLWADLPFLQTISEDRIIGENGELFCIVPLDADATVAVSQGQWDDSAGEYLYEESLYFSESGEPILLFCNNEGWEPDTQVSISGPSGDMIWYPMTDSNGCADPLYDYDWNLLMHDFSPYREMLTKDYREMTVDIEGEWVMPTEGMLIGTTWDWDGYLKDGREVYYKVTFQEDTLSVIWNDGIDFEDHEYPDAQWELTYEDDFAVLSIDFREMAGILRYNLLYSEFYDNLYFGMDVLQDSMPVGLEPLRRVMSEPMAPDVSEMLGFWELEWTEVEGYREYAQPGIENISVFLNAQDSMRLTYVNNVYFTDNLYDKEVFSYEGELYSGCGNDDWVAYLGNMEGSPIVYSFTLLDHDTLLMKIYWEIDDGVPMVSYKSFYRVTEYEYD